ncbi:BglG family transcription antiterminator [Anaerosacchariphilus polymeriproducens]|uniref:HTH domain-containing protein n=1 Tax=Anaerosacchariphilus polymeriproducens TaxID=1812858 RepID=A0A371AXR6_9FIRM|nr:PTS sugar transporter subunit IIA [Anaerosacchariphilus polymeriproducens]RDU24270.1 HTH domain-containing protein [Anaerosacchariphilus polymeriproducens]
MNKRNRDMLIYLSNHEETCTLSGLAELFRVSERSIRNDLICINEFLQEHGLTPLVLKNSGKINVGDDLRNVHMLHIEKDVYTYKLSKDERVHCMCCLLIRSEYPITLQMLAERLMVSRATTINDMEEVKKICKNAKLHVKTYSNKGLYVEGTEKNKRLLLLSIICRYADITAEKRVQIASYPGMDLLTDTKKLESEVMYSIVIEQETRYGHFFSDDSFCRLQCYLMLVFNRMNHGKFLDSHEKKNDTKYCMAFDIMKLVSQYCNFLMDEREVLMLSQILEGLHYHKKTNIDSDIVKTQLLTRRFIELISDDLQIDLKHDLTFQQDLSNHLISAFKSSAILVKNPVIDQVVKENKRVMDCVVRNIQYLESFSYRKFTETDINYIVVHICAAIERQHGNMECLNVILACNGGIGTSKLLYANLKKRFSFRISEIMTAHEIENEKLFQADLVISTTELHRKDIETIVVQAIPTLLDYQKLNEKISMVLQKKNRTIIKNYGWDNLLKEVEKIIYSELGSEGKELNNSIAKIINTYVGDRIQEDSIPFNLSELLTEKFIQLDVLCDSWKDAVSKSAKILLDNQYIEERYINEMIHSIEENGPYIVLTKGLAIPHAGIEAGTKKLGLSMIRLKEPVSFGHKTFKDIDFICCLSPIDGKKHLRAFMQLADIFSNRNKYQQLKEAKTSYEVHQLLKKYEEGIDNINI